MSKTEHTAQAMNGRRWNVRVTDPETGKDIVLWEASLSVTEEDNSLLVVLAQIINGMSDVVEMVASGKKEGNNEHTDDAADPQ